MPSSVTLFRDPRSIVVDLRIQSGDEAEATSACLYLDGVLALSMPLSDAKCDELLDHLADLRAARLRR